jgi:hypothetical protein
MEVLLLWGTELAFISQSSVQKERGGGERERGKEPGAAKCQIVKVCRKVRPHVLLVSGEFLEGISRGISSNNCLGMHGLGGGGGGGGNSKENPK